MAGTGILPVLAGYQPAKGYAEQRTKGLLR